MTVGFPILAALAITATLHGVGRARRLLRGTTLTPAWRWSCLAALVWSLVWGATVTASVSSVHFNMLWYVAALVALCPAISVLGARRPGIGSWTTFVILPMLAVLGWPVLTVWGGDQPRPLVLEAPALIGFVLVLLMGAGNYVGTKFSLSASLYVIALCLAVSPASTVAPVAIQGSITARWWSTICLGLAIAITTWQSRSSEVASTGFDRLWNDYRNTFGIVWAKRLQDRVNGIASGQKWPVRLEHHGFIWTDGLTRSQIDETRIHLEQTLRWLLRRFADPDWIDARLEQSSGEASGGR